MRGDVGRGSRASDSIVMIAGKAGDGDDVAGARHRHAQRRLGIELCVTGTLGKLTILADAIDADVGQGRWDMSLCALDGQSFTGAYLMSVGLDIPLSTEYNIDYPSRILELK